MKKFIIIALLVLGLASTGFASSTALKCKHSSGILNIVYEAGLAEVSLTDAGMFGFSYCNVPIKKSPSTILLIFTDNYFGRLYIKHNIQISRSNLTYTDTQIQGGSTGEQAAVDFTGTCEIVEYKSENKI